MTASIDAGPVAYQTLFGIEEDSALVVGTKCVEIGIKHMIDLLKMAACNPRDIPSVKQDLTLREYFGNGVPHNGWVDWTRTARQIYDFIRACDFFPLPSPWDHPKTTLHGQQLKIVKANLTKQSTLAAPGTVGEVDAAGAQVACSDQWLILREIMREGKVLKAQDVLDKNDRLVSILSQEKLFQ
jgi:methionyl-tRNA formyltransferase